MKNYELAKEDYLAGMKYKDIAAKYDVSLSTVKSWKARYWNKDNKVATKSKKVASKKQKVATKVAEELTKNDNLNQRQKMFCLFYLQSFNATQSYIKAYDVDYSTATVNGPRLLGNARVKEQIATLKKELTEELAIDTQDVINQYAKQAFSDIGDYVSFGGWREIEEESFKEEQVINDKEGKPHKLEIKGKRPVIDADGNEVFSHHNYVQFKNQDKVDTSLIKSIKTGKDGPVIELYDKQKAQEQLLKYLSGNKENVAQNINILNSWSESDDKDTD